MTAKDSDGDGLVELITGSGQGAAEAIDPFGAQALADGVYVG